MTWLLLGLNHQTAPVAVRERYALSPARCRIVNEKLAAEPELREAAVISTCNRTEIVALAKGAAAGEEVLERAFDHVIGDGSASRAHCYLHRGPDAVSHVFRVTASLDSMVLGEAQILGQMKRAYEIAAESGACGPLLSRLFHRAFRAAKRVRTETGLGERSLSLARIGVQLAQEIFESLAEKRLLLLGAGDIAEASLRGFFDAGVRRVVVLNRTPEAAARLAEPFGAQAGPLDALDDELASADVVVASVAAELPLVSPGAIERCMVRRQRRSLLLIDLGLPRNIEASVKQVNDAYLYDIDDLDQVAQRGRESRQTAIVPAQAIITHEIEQFERWQAGLRAVPIIRALLEQSRALAAREVEQALARTSVTDADTRAALARLGDAIVAKLMHAPVDALRAEAAGGGPSYFAEAIREVFGLPEEDE
jgi:glutamyl-tRNA reductase